MLLLCFYRIAFTGFSHSGLITRQHPIVSVHDDAIDLLIRLHHLLVVDGRSRYSVE